MRLCRAKGNEAKVEFWLYDGDDDTCPSCGHYETEQVSRQAETTTIIMNPFTGEEYFKEDG